MDADMLAKFASTIGSDGLMFATEYVHLLLSLGFFIDLLLIDLTATVLLL